MPVQNALLGHVKNLCPDAFFAGLLPKRHRLIRIALIKGGVALLQKRLGIQAKFGGCHDLRPGKRQPVNTIRLSPAVFTKIGVLS